MPSSQPVGIFDSGLGGLTVFRAVTERLPQESLIYLGDTARVPYGTKSAPTVTQYSHENTQFLLEKGVKAVVVACNTASAYAVSELKDKYDIPLIGVLEPGACQAIEQSSTERIGVIGTAGTIGSDAYAKAMVQMRSDVTVVSQACPLFVPLVEEGWLDRDETYSIARHYLQPLLDARVDAIILGCTHYPMLQTVIREIVGPTIVLIDSAHAAAAALEKTLREKDLLAPDGPTEDHQFWVTDEPERFARVGEIFLGRALAQVKKVP